MCGVTERSYASLQLALNRETDITDLETFRLRRERSGTGRRSISHRRKKIISRHFVYTGAIARVCNEMIM